MTNLTQPSSLRPADSTAGTHLRGSLKGALALLALVLLGLLLWQLFSQYRHTQADLRQQSLATSAELADHLSLNMALKAQQSLNLVQPYEGRHAAEKIAAGASLVQIYSGFIYKGPALIREAVDAIAAMPKP